MIIRTSRQDKKKIGLMMKRNLHGGRRAGFMSTIVIFLVVMSSSLVSAQTPLNLAPVNAVLTPEQAKHLASRAGFGATQQEIKALTGKTHAQAMGFFLGESGQKKSLAFEHSRIFEPGLDPFPPSRPATTELAKRQGHALGIKVKPEGNRPLQPIVNQFFYWLRASRLETDRVAYWLSLIHI